MLYDIKTTLPKPKWYELRKKLSNGFLWFAKKLYPENPEVWAFYMKQFTDAAIYGHSITRVDPLEFLKCCPYCNGVHDERVACPEYVNAFKKPSGKLVEWI